MPAYHKAYEPGEPAGKSPPEARRWRSRSSFIEDRESASFTAVIRKEEKA